MRFKYMGNYMLHSPKQMLKEKKEVEGVVNIMCWAGTKHFTQLFHLNIVIL